MTNLAKDHISVHLKLKKNSDGKKVKYLNLRTDID